MPVTVTLLGPLRDLAGISRVQSLAPSVRALLDDLAGQFGEEFARRARRSRILVNGEPIQFGRGVATELHDGDAVALLFPVGGG